MVVMQQGNEDSSRQVIYINGTPYVVALPSAPTGQAMPQLYIPPPPPPHQQQQQPMMETRYVFSSPSSQAGQATMAPLNTTTTTTAASHTPLAPTQVLVLHSTPAAAQTWVPVLTTATAASHQPRHFTNAPSSQPPMYCAMEALHSLNVVSLPAQSTAAPMESSGSSNITSTTSAFSPLNTASSPSVQRLRGEQCLRSLAIHQRGTARLFVGQIHYDACEDDLYQIFGVYGHVLDVKIMRSGEPAATATAASAPSVNSAPPSQPATSAPVTLSSPPTAIVESDVCNDSTNVNSVRADSVSSHTGAVAIQPTHMPTKQTVPMPTVVIASAEVAADGQPSAARSSSFSSVPPKSNRRCNAFVTFASMVEADMAISALHGRYVMGRDRPLQVTYCQATENISQFGFAHAVRLHKENRNNPLPFKSGAPTHR